MERDPATLLTYATQAADSTYEGAVEDDWLDDLERDLDGDEFFADNAASDYLTDYPTGHPFVSEWVEAFNAQIRRRLTEREA